MTGEEQTEKSIDPVSPSGGPSSDLFSRLADHEHMASRYSLKGEIARGGQGVVVRVWDQELRRHLAMKVMLGRVEDASTDSGGKTPPVDPKTLGRFLEEAQVTGQLDHPGIVPVHELGLDAKGRVCFTMKLVKGEDLLSVFDKVAADYEGWSVTRALSVLQRICEAMAYAHAKGVVHRDLKPANVMVGRFGEVYVMDWGLARVLGQPDERDLRIPTDPPAAVTSELHSDRQDRAADRPDSPLVTMDGDVVGTPAYMPPEQAFGKLDEIGPRSDVYALGAMLYQLLAGHMPYVEPGMVLSSRAVWARVQEGQPTALEKRAPDAPVELVSICEKAMARDVAERYGDMGDLAADLSAYLEDRVVRAHRAGPIAELRAWVRRNRLLASIVAAAMATISIVGLIAVRNADLAEERAVQLETTNDQLKEETLRAERQSYSAFLHAAQTELDAGNIGEAQRLHALCPESFRNWEWHHLGLGLDQSLQTLEGHEDRVTCVVWSPDGTRIVSGVTGRTLRIWDALSGESLQTLEGPAAMTSSVAWSSNGARIVSGFADGTLRIWESRLEDALPLWRAEDRRRRVRPLVQSLFEEHIFLEPVLSALRSEGSLPDDLRDVATRMAKARGHPSARDLNNSAWALVKPDREEKQTDVALGLRLARAAVELSPEDAAIRDTFAWALFANGLYDEALAEAERALELTDEDGKKEYPGHLDRLRTAVEEARARAAPRKPGHAGDR